MKWEDYFSPCEHPQKDGTWIKFCELHTETGGDLLIARNPNTDTDILKLLREYALLVYPYTQGTSLEIARALSENPSTPTEELTHVA